MKCIQCHHLNVSTEAECFMCGASLEVGLPPAHPVMFVLVAACVFIPVFAEIGGFIKLLSELGVITKHQRVVPFSRWIAVGCGVTGIRIIFYLTKLDMPIPRQILFGIVTTVACWLAYAMFTYGLVRENNLGRPTFGDRGRISPAYAAITLPATTPDRGELAS